jgi:FKBP-type peptidyl-prolyl cis-trans isomerase FkpA
MIRINGLTSLLLLTAVLMLLLGSCDPGRKYEKEEEAQIQDYLSSNPALAFELQSSGLYYLPVNVGDGTMPVKDDIVYIKYSGKFLNGIEFGTNIGKIDTLKFQVGGGWVIDGLDLGVSLMSEGGKAMLLIPSKLAWGPTGSDTGIIPGYTPVLFDVELVKVMPPPAE